MPRDISRNSNQIGSSKKSAPRVEDPTIQKVINGIYEELNRLKISSSKEPIGAQSQPSDGDSGDIRLYTKKAEDGSTGFFIQGKFGESWASGRLGVDLIDPNLPVTEQLTVSSYVDDGGEYITKLGVTFENLVFNNSVGAASNQVAVGNHNHNHNTLVNAVGFRSHSQIDDHIDDSTIHFTTGDLPSGPGVGLSNDSGIASTAARSDHKHELDTDQAYTWGATQTITVNSGTALDVTGDVEITGDLIVDWSIADDSSGNLNLTNDATIGGDLSVDGLSALDSTIIEETAANQLSIRYNSTNKLDINVAQNGLTTLIANNGIQVDASSLRPMTNIATDLGQSTKRWNSGYFQSLYADELIVETLVAQDVMATIGGRIMVAPTTKLTNSITNQSIAITVEHNIFHENDFILLKTAPGGLAQQEVMQVTADTVTANPGPYVYNVTRNIDATGVGAHSFSDGDAVVNLGHEQGDGYIELTSTQSIHDTQGPKISLRTRTETYTDNQTTWNEAAEIVRIGNLDGTGYTGNNTDYGMIIGQNIANPATHSTDPFKGLVVDKGTFKLFNTNYSSYTGQQLSVYIGQDERPGLSDKVAFVMGNGIGLDPNNEWENDIFKFAYNSTTGQYDLSLTGQLNVLGQDNAPYVAGYNVNETVLDSNGEDAQITFPIAGTNWSSGDDLYGHFKLKNAQGDVTIQFTDNRYPEGQGGGPPVVTWTTLAVVNQNANDSGFEKWYTFSVTPANSAHTKAFRVLYTGGGSNEVTVKSILSTVKTSGNPEAIASLIIAEIANNTADNASNTANNAIPGNSDFTLTNDINIGSGSISIGTVAGAAISAGLTNFNTDNNVPGFRLGVDSEDSTYKFLVKNNSSTDPQYIKVDTASANAVEIKGALHADKLANVNPKIADAGGTYRNLSIIKHHFDGYLDIQSNSGPGDMTSSSCVVEGVRNGAIVTVHIAATATGGPTDRSFWVNPRIVYAKSGTGFPSSIPDNVSGKFRLGNGWKEVDWIPFADAQITDDSQESTSPPFWKIDNAYFEYVTGSNFGGSSPWEYNGNALILEIDPDENDIGITPDNDFIQERFGGDLTALQFGIWNTENAYSNAIKVANMLWVGSFIGWNGSKAKIGLLPTTGDNYGGGGTSAVGSVFKNNQPYGPEYYEVRTGTDMHIDKFDNDLLQLGYAGNTEFYNYGNSIDEDLGGVGMTVAFDTMTYMPSWTTSVRNKIYPTAFIGDPGSSLPNAMWYFYGGTNKDQYDNYSSNPASCPCPFTRALIYAKENNELTNLKVGVEPISFYVADDYYKTFNHTYTFKVDIPDLHTGANAGKININFGTGTPWSAWPTYGEERNILDVTFNVTVDNGG